MSNKKEILFELFNQNNPNDALVWVEEPHGCQNDAEKIALHEAKKYSANAVYFRRLDENTSLSQIYIYDQDLQPNLDDAMLIDIHRNIWSSSVVPFFYVVSQMEVKIFDCTKSLNNKDGKIVPPSPFQLFDMANRAQQALEREKFAFHLFNNGSFWELPEHENLLNAANSPYHKLLSGLLDAKKDLLKRQSNLDKNAVGRLLVMCLLVRFLEEKQDDKGRKLLDIYRDFYKEFDGAKNFVEVLEKGYCIAFFEKLATKFNGKVFDLKQGEKQALQGINLVYVAAIFGGKMESKTKQYVFWDLYSFNYLPIELISGIYEAFLKIDENQREKGTVYTPPFLVNFLVDECMPIYKAKAYFANEQFKVLDPACGSGIFLVAALKRMIEWKALIDMDKNGGNLVFPNKKIIQRIIKNNIFGTDIEYLATQISIFSLSLVLCHHLSPMEIWEGLQFNDLSQDNILQRDFFVFYKQHKNSEQKFDLVIGNPPFNVPSTNKNYLKELKTDKELAFSNLVPNDLALHFLDRSMPLAHSVCLILKANTFLYNGVNDAQYRIDLLQQYDVHKVIDFTHLSDKLFHKSANIAVCALLIKNQLPSQNAIIHQVAKRIKITEDRIQFEFDYYDFHTIPYRVAINENSRVWKNNLMGGGRIWRVINNLDYVQKFGAYLKEKEKQFGWKVNDGYKTGQERSEKTEAEMIAAGYTEAPYITGFETVITESFTNEGFKTEPELKKLFESPRKEKQAIYYTPHVLIKEVIGLPIHYVEYDLRFKNAFIGIHAPETDAEVLKQIVSTFNNHRLTYQFFITCTSGRSGVTMSFSTIKKEDIDNLPYPDNEAELELGYDEQIVRDDVLNYLMYLNSSNKEKNPYYLPTAANNLQEYGEVFCRVMNPVYAHLDKKWFIVGFKQTISCTIYAFAYGVPSNGLVHLVQDFETEIQSLLYNEQNAARYTRIVRYYHRYEDSHFMLFLIKPNALRYWLQSVGLQDADQTFADLKKSGF